MTAQEKANRILKSNGASYWLKDAIKALWNRDCVDAARDARILAEVIEQRADEVLGQ